MQKEFVHKKSQMEMGLKNFEKSEVRIVFFFHNQIGIYRLRAGKKKREGGGRAGALCNLKNN